MRVAVARQAATTHNYAAVESKNATVVIALTFIKTLDNLAKVTITATFIHYDSNSEMSSLTQLCSVNNCSHSTHTHMHCGDTFTIKRGITNHVVHTPHSQFAPYQGSL